MQEIGKRVENPAKSLKLPTHDVSTTLLGKAIVCNKGKQAKITVPFQTASGFLPRSAGLLSASNLTQNYRSYKHLENIWRVEWRLTKYPGSMPETTLNYRICIVVAGTILNDGSFLEACDIA